MLYVILLHAHIFFTPIKTNICMVQYTHGILISILISFYILPLLFSFFLHAKLIYFIRTRHDHHYLTPTTYILPMKRNNITEFQSKKRSNKEQSSIIMIKYFYNQNILYNERSYYV